MSEAENLELVAQGYAALERDDIPGFLELCGTDAEWVYPAPAELLYGGEWRGHDGIAAFFNAHDAAEDILEVRVVDSVARGDRVFVLGVFRGRAKPSGQAWETRFVHVITLRDGFWQRFEAFFDTASAVEAHQG